ncbi:MAG: hypothetical protein JW994_00185 [Candidatus Omnitrophica bacterium]|nr:hypothetical protein [Candidatus Omnitrophota bacterium]
MKHRTFLFPILIPAAIAAFLFIDPCLFCKTKPKKFEIDLNKLLYPPSGETVKKDAPYLKPYTDFLENIYEKMDTEYYLPVSKKTYEEFVEYYRDNILARLKDKQNVLPEIKYLGAGLLVKKLKDPNDTFSNFYPPFEAEEFKSTVLGYELGLGITGRMADTGYVIERVELRSDAYAKGIRASDIIKTISGKSVQEMSEDELKNNLFPPLGATVELGVYSYKRKKVSLFKITVIEFFKETLSSVPTGIPGMFYVKINQFNKKTGEDLERLVDFFTRKGMKRLVIDLRDNAGGPPLAARQIAGIFLPPNEPLFSFRRKNRPEITLKTPYSPINYKGEIAIIINHGSGSASELFSGTMRSYRKACLIGERSAGKTFLKSMFRFDDNSMLLLTTSLTYLYSGKTFDSAGLKPDFTVMDESISFFPFVNKCMDSFYEK